MMGDGAGERLRSMGAKAGDGRLENPAARGEFMLGSGCEGKPGADKRLGVLPKSRGGALIPLPELLLVKSKGLLNVESDGWRARSDCKLRESERLEKGPVDEGVLSN